ncbi:MAG: OmpA family protein [Geminicoccaceae bacterium]
MRAALLAGAVVLAGPHAFAQDTAAPADDVPRVDEVSEAIAEVRRKIEEMKAARGESIGAPGLGAELSAARAQIRDLTAALEEARAERDVARTELLARERAQEENSGALVEAENARTAALAEVERARAAEQAAQEQVEALELELAATSSRLEEVETRLGALTESVAADTAEAQISQTQLETLQQALSERDATIEGLRAERRDLEARVAELDARAVSLQQALDQAQSAGGDIELELADALARVTDLETAAASARERANSLARDLAESEEARNAAQDRVASLEDEAESRAQTYNTALSERDDLLARIETLQTDLAATQAQLSQAQQQVTVQSEQLALAQDAAGGLQQEVDELEAMRARNAKEMADLGDQLITALTEIQGLDAAFGQATAARDAMAAELEDARAALAPAQAEIERLREELAGKDTAIAAAQTERDAAAQRMALLEEQLGGQADPSAVLADLEDLRAERTELVQKAARLEASNIALETELEAVRRVTEARIGQLIAAAAGTDGSSDLEAELARARDRIAELQARLALAEADGIEPAAGTPETEPAPAPASEARAAPTNASGELVAAGLAAPQNTATSRPERALVESYLDELGAVPVEGGWLVTMADAAMFAPGSDTLADDAGDKLREVARLISVYQGDEVIIIGHTDASGDESVNLRLSENRARRVRDFLAEAIDGTEARFEVIGVGESQPVASNETAAGRSANRRVEIILR